MVSAQIGPLKGVADVRFGEKRTLRSSFDDSTRVGDKARRKTTIALRPELDNPEKVQAALNAYTQAALTYAVRIQRNLRHRYHHKQKI